MASSNVERDAAILEIVDLTWNLNLAVFSPRTSEVGVLVLWWKAYCGIVDDVRHNSLLVFIARVEVVQFFAQSCGQ